MTSRKTPRHTQDVKKGRQVALSSSFNCAATLPMLHVFTSYNLFQHSASK